MKIWKITTDEEIAAICECMIFANTEKEAWEIFSKNEEHCSEDLGEEIGWKWYKIKEIIDTTPRILFTSVQTW